jgi:hypothetical protein
MDSHLIPHRTRSPRRRLELLPKVIAVAHADKSVEQRVVRDLAVDLAHPDAEAETDRLPQASRSRRRVGRTRPEGYPQLGILDHTSCPDDMLVVTAAERRTCRKLAWRPTPMGGGNSMTSCGKSSVAILASALVSN